MPAVPSSILEPLWVQFAALLPERPDHHPLGCHRPRIPDRFVFDKLVQVLVLGAAYNKIADATCSATTMRRRRDEWITAGVFTRLEDLCLEAYDQIVGLKLDNIIVDGCIVKAPCGGQAAGKSPVDRSKQGTKRSLMAGRLRYPDRVPGRGRQPPRLATAGSHTGQAGPVRVRPTRAITVHLDAGYDSGKTRDLLELLGCDWVISTKGEPLQAGARWVVERTNSWHNRGFKKLLICTERRTIVIEAFIALANAIIITRRLIGEAWTRYRWETRPNRKP